MLKNLNTFMLLLIAGVICFGTMAGASANYEPDPSQQTEKVTGVVQDAAGPLGGAYVGVKGTGNGTVTDATGNFTLDKVKQGEVLQISLLGYLPQEITYAGQTFITVKLEEDAQSLGEVVVTALGIKKEVKSIGYATQKLGGEEIVRANAANLAGSLAGKIAGVNINNANQLDGGSSRIVIRGNNAIQGNNQPLIVVDGMPLENTPTVKLSGTSEDLRQVRDYGSGLNYINNYDIEDLNVLKGPAAAALYGARGANGVILITTKKGSKKEGLGIDYSFTSKIINPYRFREQQKEYGYGGLHYPMYSANNEYQKDANGVYLYPKQTWGNGRWDAQYGQMPGGYNTYDDATFSWHAYSMSWGRRLDGTPIKWWDGVMRPHVADSEGERFFYKNGVTNTHNVSFSNGGDFGSVRVGITRDDHNAVVRNSDYNRTAVTLAANLNVSSKIKTEVYGAYTNYFRHNVVETGDADDGSGFTKAFYVYPSDYKPWLDLETYKNPDGSRRANPDVYGNNELFWTMLEKSYDYQRDQLLGSIKLIYNPFDWLTFSVQSGIDLHTDEYINKRQPSDAGGYRDAIYEHKMGRERVTNTDLLATAKKDNVFVDRFNASFSLGATRWDRRYYQLAGTSDNAVFKDPYLFAFRNIDLTQQSGTYKEGQLPSESYANKRINSVYGFLDLSYNDFIYLQVTGRNDWSSTLPVNSNSYFYPSASLSFVPTSLLSQPISWLNFTKLRLAYASAATDTDPYQVTPTYSSGSYGGAPTVSLPGTLPAINLKPQRANSYELGLEAVLFDYRLRMDLTLYRTRAYNQIMDAPIAYSSGFGRVRINTGEMENKGIEFIASYEVLRSKDWNWRAGLNLGHNKNTLLSMSDNVNVFEIGQIFGGQGPVVQVEVGDSYGNIYGADYVRNEQGEKIVDILYYRDGSGKVAGTKYRTSADRKKLGNITPDVIGGVNSTLRWKNFSLYALVGFSFGGDLWSGTYATSLSSGLSPSTLSERNGGGLPYVYPDGTSANHGVILDGVIEHDNGGTKTYTPNTEVVHYIWKYGQSTAWGYLGQNLNATAVLKNNWIKMNEITLSYDLPRDVVRKTKVFQSLGLMLSGRDLFYIYSSLPDNLNPEALSNSAGNAQGLEFGALPGMRTFSFTVKLGF